MDLCRSEFADIVILDSLLIKKDMLFFFESLHFVFSCCKHFLVDLFCKTCVKLFNVTCAVWVERWVGASIWSMLPPWPSWQLLLPRSPRQLTAGSYLPRMPYWLGVGQSNWACSSLPVAHYCLTKSLPPLCFPFLSVALISPFPWFKSPWMVQSQITQTTEH